MSKRDSFLVGTIVLAAILVGIQAYLLSGFIDSGTWIRCAGMAIVAGSLLLAALVEVAVSVGRRKRHPESPIQGIRCAIVYLLATAVMRAMPSGYWRYHFWRLRPRFEEVIARIESGELKPIGEGEYTGGVTEAYLSPGVLALSPKLADASAGGRVLVSRMDDGSLHVAFRLLLDREPEFEGFLYTSTPLPPGSWSPDDCDDIEVGPCSVDIEEEVAPNWYRVECY